MPKSPRIFPPEPASPIELFSSERSFEQVAGRPRKVLTLHWDEMRPAIRLAHQLEGTLNFNPRLIFDHMLFYVVSGGTRWTMADQVMEAGPGDLIFVPPFDPHSSMTGENGKCRHIAVHFDWKPRFPGHSRHGLGREPYEVLLPDGIRIPPLQHFRNHDTLPGLLERIVTLRLQGDSLSALQADAILFEVLIALFQGRQKDTTVGISRREHMDRARIETALALMEASLTTPLHLASLAEAAGLSSSRFSHLFRRVTGRSPMEHFSAMRISRARELLKDCRVSIKEVASSCGFEDPYHFSKVFSRVDGMSPSQFRETVLRSGS